MTSKKIWIFLLTLMLTLSGCSSSKSDTSNTMIFGDTSFNSENEEGDIDPHHTYGGWAALRYGVGETLFRLNDEMELEPWLAESYENPERNTWIIHLRKDIYFSDGRYMDGQSVKECLEDLIKVLPRAADDLKIETIEAQSDTVTIHTSEPNPTLLNGLADPYACIIDMQAGNANGIVSGTGPFIATELETDDHLNLIRNEHYWNGKAGVKQVKVKTYNDGDALALALKSGEIDAAYGMAYVNYPLFENENYTFSTVTTSRTFYLQMNFHSEIIQDDAVRKAIAMGIDKESFVSILLHGYGEAGTGPFPFDQNAAAQAYDPENAKKILEEAGWVDTDGDGIREKNGTKLQIRWLTYPSRSELPILGEAAQASLKKIGIDVILNVTSAHNTIVSDASKWDIYAASFVTCPTGDPMYFFTTHCLSTSLKNRGNYYNAALEKLAVEMNQTFDISKRLELAEKMSQEILNDNAFVFCSYLRMSMIYRKDIYGLTAHPSDYYEFTSDLGMNQHE